MVRVLPCCLLLACAAPQQLLRKDQQEVAFLGDAAADYWRSYRWGDTAGAAAFIEDADQRLAFEAWLQARQDQERLTDVSVLRVVLDPPDAPLAEGHMREATVNVRTEGYRVGEQVLQTEIVEQRWYRTDRGWFVSWP